ncbi:MAG: ABC transporter substrate-binding protein [Parvibaculaceae bacterium]|nr:ABC transporter substrate-binding protein [Parvibaculaceae bacterium]
MPVTRRHILQMGLVSVLLPSGFSPLRAATPPQRGGRLIIGQFPEATLLTSGFSTEGIAQAVSTKIFDGLVAYDTSLNPVPQLATAWKVSPDQLSISLDLRPGVTWHDGTPFTSADVAFSCLELWKKYHSRGRSTFANVVSVDTPDPLSAIFHLSKPAPYLLAALGSSESQVLPRHLYQGTDILQNPHNVAPIGTGPFRFVEWKRGEYIALARNPNYWDQPKPYLDEIIYRVLPDPAAQSVALETGEIQLGAVTPSDIDRLSKEPSLVLDPVAPRYSLYSGLAFNLDKPFFRDVRVRQAIAHAIDTRFILKNVYYGHGTVGTGPLPSQVKPFYTDDVPHYPFNPARAIELLDAAGFKPDAKGTRISAIFRPQATGDAAYRQAEYIRTALGQVGIALDVQWDDFAGFIRRIYTERDFDITTYGGSAGPDPAIGTQRIYWSKNFKPGVAFSNVAHYVNPEVDKLLEDAQIETDPARRYEFYKRFQQIVQTDLPLIPLVNADPGVLRNRRLIDYSIGGDGTFENFASAQLLPE